MVSRHKKIRCAPKFCLVVAIFAFVFQIANCSPDTKGQENDICPEEGFFPDPRSCRRFYRCVETYEYFYAYEFECPRRTVFDPEAKVCNHPYAVRPTYRCHINNLFGYNKVKKTSAIKQNEIKKDSKESPPPTDVDKGSKTE